MIKSLFACVFLFAVSSALSCYDGGRDGKRTADGGAGGPKAYSQGGTTVPVSGRDFPLPLGRKKWTVMVHMNGDNNLSGYSSRDILEMMESGSGENMNIVVLWDNDPSQENGAPQRHGYYYIEKEGAVLLRDTGEVNMGSAATAKKFGEYAVKKFPAERYVWIFWNHGGAVDRSRGISWDDSSGGDHLSETEQKEVMEYLVKKAGKKFDIVGFDACLMATAELVYQYRDFASYLVASEQTIPGMGWDYGFLKKIMASPAMVAVTAARHIVTYYKNFYGTTDEGKDSTLSVLDLASAGSLGKAIDRFSQSAMKSGVSGGEFRKSAQGLPMFGVAASGGKNYYYTKDLCAYVDRIAKSTRFTGEVRERAREISSLIKGKRLVVSEWHGSGWSRKAFGLAMTFKYATETYRKLDICRDGGWDEFLNWAGFPDSDLAE